MGLASTAPWLTALIQAATSWENRIGLFFAAAGAGIMGIFGTYKLIVKLIRDARTARAAEEQRTLQRIEEGIAKCKADSSHQLELAQQLTEHWKDMAGVFEKEKNHEREAYQKTFDRMKDDNARLREERAAALHELSMAKMKIEEVVDLNLGLQGQITETNRRMTEAERVAKDLAEKVSKLHGG